MPNVVTLLLQIAAVVIATRLAGRAIGWIGQPRVVGEMVAGILLGPSLLGWALPEVSRVLFPPDSFTYLNMLSQIGLLLFMFLVGLEFNTQELRRLGRVAVATSLASIVAPFVLGGVLASFAYSRLADPNIPRLAFVLFLAAAMSVTAFPVLARILADRGLTRTELGVLAITCASVDDVCAWFILAYVISFARASEEARSPWVLFAAVTAFVVVMIFAIRPVLKKFYAWLAQGKGLNESLMVATLILLLLSAAFTEWLGIHLLFGAFLLGAIVPRDAGLVHALSEKLESITKVLLLPIYFVYTGLRTSIGSVRGAEMWMYCVAIIVVAIAGKFGGAYIAARAAGEPARKAAALGALMNTRGLMQLIVLNAGLELGVINETVFSMMVIMALVTTFLTTPLVKVFTPLRMRGCRR